MSSYRGFRLAGLGAVCCFIAAILVLSLRAGALLTGEVGNAPIEDHDWPAGSVDVANLPRRLGFWEGPLGGGEFLFIYRGDTAAFQEALNRFAKIRAPELRVVINEGREESFWLQLHQSASSDTHVDWTFIVWTPRIWDSLYNDPQSTFMSSDPSGNFRNQVAPPTLAVNVAAAGGEGIDCAKIRVPDGVTVIDERATSAGYTREDGSVLRGDVYDLLTSKPIVGADITVGKLNAQNAFDAVAGAKSDGAGHFEIKHIPAGSYRVSAAAARHAARIIGYDNFGRNTIKRHVVQLASAIVARGVVNTTDGKPVAGVKVRADGVIALDGRGYLPVGSIETVTDADGKFELSGLPEGYFQIDARDSSHQQEDILHLYGPPMNGMPAKVYEGVSVVMTATGIVKGKVVGLDGRPNGKGNVHLVPPGGERVGMWSGSMNVGADGTFEFDGVPPGSYLLGTGMAMPGKNDPTAKEVQVKAGETTEIELGQ